MQARMCVENTGCLLEGLEGQFLFLLVTVLIIFFILYSIMCMQQ